MQVLYYKLLMRSHVLLYSVISFVYAHAQDCPNPCDDCNVQVDTLLSYDIINNPIRVGTGYEEFSVIQPFSGGSSLSSDGWLNSTTAAPLSIVSNELYLLFGGCSEFVAEARLTFSSQLVQGSVSSPEGINQDPMYGAGRFGVSGDGITYAFVLTNTRVYAMIEKKLLLPPSITNNAEGYTYLIPIACRRPKDTNSYRVIMRPATRSVWFQIDGKDLLAYCSGGDIAQKFKVREEGGLTTQVSFPKIVQIILGDMVQPRGYPHAACQQALFDSNKDKLSTASSVCCTYAAWQDPREYLVLMKMRYWELQVLQTYCGEECPEPCCPAEHNICVKPLSSSSSSSSSSCESSSSSSSSDVCPQGWRDNRNQNEGHQWTMRNIPRRKDSSASSESSSSCSTSSSFAHRDVVVKPRAWLGAHASASRRKPGRYEGRHGRLVEHEIW